MSVRQGPPSRLSADRVTITAAGRRRAVYTTRPKGLPHVIDESCVPGGLQSPCQSLGGSENSRHCSDVSASTLRLRQRPSVDSGDLADMTRPALNLATILASIAACGPTMSRGHLTHERAAFVTPRGERRRGELVTDDRLDSSEIATICARRSQAPCGRAVVLRTTTPRRSPAAALRASHEPLARPATTSRRSARPRAMCPPAGLPWFLWLRRNQRTARP